MAVARIICRFARNGNFRIIMQPAPVDTPLLQVVGLGKRFGGVAALTDVSLSFPARRITGLIGPNGAGKTTLFNLIAGSLYPSSGEIYLEGQAITDMPPEQRFACGVLRTFQLSHEFSSLTVLENLLVVPPGQIGERLAHTWWRRAAIAREERRLRERAEWVLEFLQLTRVAGQRAGQLSGGQKKLLEIGRTMMADAKVVLLDEAGAGVNRALLGQIGDSLLRLNREQGYTFCMIEHDMSFISRLCDNVVVLAEGRVLTRGSPAEVQRDEQVIESYLGGGAAL